MSEQEIKLKLNDHDHEIKSLKHRVDSVEKKQKDIYELTTAVNKLAVSVEFMAKEQSAQGERLQKLEAQPLEDVRYVKRTVISCIITTVVGGVIGALLTLLIGG